MPDTQTDSDTTAAYRLGVNDEPIDLRPQPLARLLNWLEEDVTSKDDYRRLARGEDPAPGVQKTLKLYTEAVAALRAEITRRVEGASS